MKAKNIIQEIKCDYFNFKLDAWNNGFALLLAIACRSVIQLIFPPPLLFSHPISCQIVLQPFLSPISKFRWFLMLHASLFLSCILTNWLLSISRYGLSFHSHKHDLLFLLMLKLLGPSWNDKCDLCVIVTVQISALLSSDDPVRLLFFHVHGISSFQVATVLASMFDWSLPFIYHSYTTLKQCRKHSLVKFFWFLNDH